MIKGINDAVLTQQELIYVDYRKSYFMLFNAITDALEKINQGNVAESREILIRAQQVTEEYYIKFNNDRNASF